VILAVDHTIDLSLIMATSQADPKTDFSGCIRKGRRNACVEIKYCTCETADNKTEGAAKDESLRESCPKHKKADDTSLTADTKDT
jgi:hypothetical protein